MCVPTINLLMDVRTSVFPMVPQDLQSHDFGLRERGLRIQTTRHSLSSNLDNLGAPSFFLSDCTLKQHRWLRVRILAVAKLHLILWQCLLFGVSALYTGWRIPYVFPMFDGYVWSGRRLTQIQATTRPEHVCGQKFGLECQKQFNEEKSRNGQSTNQRSTMRESRETSIY